MNAHTQFSKLKIVVFDMDGVLVDVKSSWQFIHESYGKNNSENLKRCEKGEITYREFMKRDIALWGKHVHIDEIKNILYKAPLMLGLEPTFESLRAAGLKTAIISAGVSILAERLQTILGLDYIFANRILTDHQGFLTGEGVVAVGLLDKLRVLNELMAAEHLSLAECAVVGDSSYDVPMFKKAGLSIAFNPDEESVRYSAEIVIEKKDLREILPYLTPTFNAN